LRRIATQVFREIWYVKKYCVSPEMQMPKRTAKFVSAIFASIIAGTAFTTISHSETVVADNCLTSPKGETPAGSHWYYRIDHSTKRHCWYLREEGEGVSQASPQNIQPPAKPAAPQAEPPSQRSVVNARAELAPQTNRDGAPNAVLPAAPAGLGDAVRAGASNAHSSSAVVASRWPDPAGASPTSAPRLGTTNLAANAPTDSIAAPEAAVATAPLTNVDPSPRNQQVANPILLAAIIGSLMLASAIGAIVSRFGRRQRPRRAPARLRRRSMWETTDDNRIALSDHPARNALRRRPQFARGTGETRVPSDGTVEFYSRSSGRART
jgi:hypothetical protein